VCPFKDDRTTAYRCWRRPKRLSFNDKGLLVTKDDQEVIIVEKTDKPISLTKQYDLRINENGEIFAGGERYGRIAMKIMDNKPVKLHQGFVEGSNVNLMSEMVALSLTFRSFEASEKALGMETSVDKDLIEKYGRNV
jgi:flagellar basal body rod protein FlgF